MECLHSFCHECIVKTVQPGRGTTNACPTCGIKLGNNPFVEKKVVKDQVKVSIVDKLRASGVLVGSGGGGAAAVEVTARSKICKKSHKSQITLTLDRLDCSWGP